MKKYAVALATVVLLSSAGSAAFAQNRAAGSSPSGNTEFNFTDELVQGQLVRPDGEVSRVRRRGPGISLIRIREHFIPEMLKSVENL